MNFIEELFGFSPDGGDGTTELIWIAAAIGIAVLVGLRWYTKRKAARPGRT